jgi:hypothetical protein
MAVGRDLDVSDNLLQGAVASELLDRFPVLGFAGNCFTEPPGLVMSADVSTVQRWRGDRCPSPRTEAVIDVGGTLSSPDADSEWRALDDLFRAARGQYWVRREGWGLGASGSRPCQQPLWSGVTCGVSAEFPLGVVM